MRKEGETKDYELDTALAIAQMVRDERERAHLTQIQLAQRCGMGQGRISGIECGHINLSVDALQRLAKAFRKNLVIRFE